MMERNHGAALSIRGLRTEFPLTSGTVVAVDGLDLDVMPGECLGIVGESGSGKTVSFLSLLGMLSRPGKVTAGEAWFGDQNLVALSQAELRRLRGREIGITFQDAKMALNPSLTIGDQILEVIAAHGGDAGSRWNMRNRKAQKQAVDMLSRVGIPDASHRLHSYPHQFSGGMRQRAMIATALVCGPKLLIADEPTSALDVTVQAQVLELIGDMRRALGMTVVLIAHDLGVVAEHCDRIAVMYAGQIVECGRTEEVLESPRHPYTKGLIASAPWLEQIDQRLIPMPGSVPNLINLPPGCHFAPRCSFRTSACSRPVALSPHRDERAVRCILSEEALA